jgi:DNA-3-methyladenine glycosylase II
LELSTRSRVIPINGPFDFDLALGYLSTWTAATFEQVDLEARVYQRAIRVGSHDVRLTVRPTDTGLELAVTGPGITDEIAECAEQVVRRVFSLDADPTPFMELAGTDTVLAPLIERFPTMRPVTIPDLYETLVWSILGQQINVGFARRLKLRLVDLCGHTLTIDGQDYRLMPLPDEVAALDPAELIPLQFSRQKTSYIIGLSQLIANGDLDLEELRGLPEDEVVATLTSVRGIGRWTAEYALMRGLGHPDIIPAGDVSLQLLIGTAAIGRRATEAELREIAERWRPWRGWATFFVWMSRQFGG